jgi:hypothetical protein
MAYGNPLKTTKLPKNYERFSPEHWEAKADQYLALARKADGRTSRIQYALDKRDACRLAASILRRLTCGS